MWLKRLLLFSNALNLSIFGQLLVSEHRSVARDKGIMYKEPFRWLPCLLVSMLLWSLLNSRRRRVRALLHNMILDKYLLGLSLLCACVFLCRCSEYDWNLVFQLICTRDYAWRKAGDAG